MTPATFRAAIEASGMSQQAVARAFGVAPSTVRRWLSGALAVPQWVPLALAGLKRLQEATQAPLPHPGVAASPSNRLSFLPTARTGHVMARYTGPCPASGRTALGENYPTAIPATGAEMAPPCGSTAPTTAGDAGACSAQPHSGR